jgi:very-short-patch-repair endonuclease
VKSLSLAIEIDGISHEGKDLYDGERQLYLENLGLRVYRIKDSDLNKRVNNVMKDLEEYIIEEFGIK